MTHPFTGTSRDSANQTNGDITARKACSCGRQTWEVVEIPQGMGVRGHRRIVALSHRRMHRRISGNRRPAGKSAVLTGWSTIVETHMVLTHDRSPSLLMSAALLSYSTTSILCSRPGRPASRFSALLPLLYYVHYSLKPAPHARKPAGPRQGAHKTDKSRHNHTH
eukprot:scaffold17815_cov112-Isochrysis_galbana.AAC.10